MKIWDSFLFYKYPRKKKSNHRAFLFNIDIHDTKWYNF